MSCQMPIVDGLSATKMIRAFETSRTSDFLSPRAALNGRIPIIAVSASLVEKEHDTYVSAGFDGWDPQAGLNFKRLSVLLHAIVEDDARRACVYVPGEWECGGWFELLHTAPSLDGLTPTPTPMEADKRLGMDLDLGGMDGSMDTISHEQKSKDESTLDLERADAASPSAC